MAAEDDRSNPIGRRPCMSRLCDDQRLHERGEYGLGACKLVQSAIDVGCTLRRFCFTFLQNMRVRVMAEMRRSHPLIFVRAIAGGRCVRHLQRDHQKQQQDQKSRHEEGNDSKLNCGGELARL